MVFCPVCIAWPSMALNPGIKRHRKLQGLILDRRADELGCPLQHLHHHSMVDVTSQAIKRFGNAYGWVTVRAVMLDGMHTCGWINDKLNIQYAAQQLIFEISRTVLGFIIWNSHLL